MHAGAHDQVVSDGVGSHCFGTILALLGLTQRPLALAVHHNASFGLYTSWRLPG